MPETNSPIELEIIEENSIIQIEISTDLYKRLQDLIFHFFPFKDLTHFTEIIAKIKAEKTSDDPLAHHLHSVLYLTNLIEDAARKSGKISKKKYDVVEKKIID